MDISVGDRVEMKKQHPCGCKTFEILRVGMDFKIKCEKCGREVMAPRAKIEKNIKKIQGRALRCGNSGMLFYALRRRIGRCRCAGARGGRR